MVKSKAKTKAKTAAKGPIHDHCVPPKDFKFDELSSYGRNHRWFNVSQNVKPALAFIAFGKGEAQVLVARCSCKDYLKCPRSAALDMASQVYGSASVIECEPIKIE